MRRMLLLLIICLCSAAVITWADEKPDAWRATAHAAAARAADWLVAQQDKDLGWHSRTYGNLKEGPAITSLAVYSLGHLPPDLREKYQTQATSAFKFLAAGRTKKGAIACRDGSLDYPTYATAIWLTSRRLWGHAADASDQLSAEYLLTAQLTAGRGFNPEHAAFGAWDLLGPGDAVGISTGSNVSVTVFALEALEPLDTSAVRTAKKEARGWLTRAAALSADGGFPFSAEAAEHQHKAGLRDEKPPRPFSYGSTTADGVRGLLLAETESEQPAVVKGLAWLVQRDKLDIVPGFEQLPPEIGWQRGLRFYYYQSLAKTLRHFPPAEQASRRSALAKIIVAQQLANGSWVNESARMREDDPLIATSFGLIALGELLSRPE